MEWLVLEMRSEVRCTECRVPTPLAGLRRTVDCTNCAEPLQLLAMLAGRTGGPRHAFGGYYDALAEALARGEAELHDLRGDPELLVRLRHTLLECPCGGALAIPTSGRYVKCDACGDAVPVRWPDDTTRAWEPRLWCVVGDAGDRAGGLDCKACKQPLVRQGRRRALVCAHCGAANYIGDAAWTKLFPSHPFCLVYKLDAATLATVHAFLAGKHPGVSRGEALVLSARLELERIAAAPVGEGTIALATVRLLLARDDLTLHQIEAIDSRLTDAERRQLLRGKLPTVLVRRWATSGIAAMKD